MKFLRRLSSYATFAVAAFATSFGLDLCLVEPALAARKQDKSIEDELKLTAGDETGNEVKAMKTEILVMRSEKKALEQLEKLKIRHKGTRMEAEILFRLGEIHMRRARTERFFEIHRDSTQVVRFAPEMVKNASEVAEIRRAIKIYLDLAERFPRFRALDAVTFNTAYAYQQVGDDKNAETQFKLVLSRHAGSPLVPDALLSLGEINYARRQFPVALEYFGKIKAFPEARVFPFGLYKGAWCRYNMQDEAAGITLLEAVIEFGHERAERGGGMAKLDLRKEALGDLALFYSEVRRPEFAVEYFTAQARDLDAVPFILRLVEIYKRHSKYSEVDVVLRGILAKAPQSGMIASVHEELIWNADRLKRRDVAAKQLVELERTCRDMDSDQAEKKDCDAKVVSISKTLGARLHAFWKKEKSDELADLALQTYEINLKNATIIGHELAQVRYAYADLLFARGRFRESSTNYEMVNALTVNSSRRAPASAKFELMQVDPKLAVDANYGAVVALEKAVGDRHWSDTDEAAFTRLADLYLKRAPKGPYALDLRFKKAFIAYEKENYDKAAPGFKAIGWAPEADANPKVLKAQDLYLDILNIKRDYTALKEAAYALLARAPEKSREDHLTKIRREAWFAEIGEIEVKGDHAKAVAMYRSFATENRSNELAPRAWWNASQILFKTGDAKAGADMCAQMNSMFPGASNAKDCLSQAAKTFEAMARLDLAAKVLLSLADVEIEKKQQWRELATDFLGLSGSRDSKLQAVQTLVKMVDEKDEKGTERKAEAKTKLLEKAWAFARELRDAKLMTLVRGKIELLGIEPAMSRFAVEEAEAAYAAGDAAKAFALSKKIVGRESKLANDKALPARARFIQARILEDEYRAQSVKARVERIGTVLALKTERLEKAQKAYQSAARIGDGAVGIQSWARLADLYLDYAKTVKAMTLPADVPEADQKTFKAEVEQIALPMEEKGIEALNQAVEAAKKSARFDGLAGDLQEKLDRLNLKPQPAMKVEVEKIPRLLPGFEKRGAASILGWRGEPKNGGDL